jgi:transcriptional regulator with XRE-family HTH domain
MSVAKTLMSHGEFGAKMRREQGAYLASLRKNANLTQAEVARALGFMWPAVVGDTEQGRSSLAPEHYVAYARLVGVDPKEFVQTILRWHNPWAWAVLFGGGDTAALQKSTQEIVDKPTQSRDNEKAPKTHAPGVSPLGVKRPVLPKRKTARPRQPIR